MLVRICQTYAVRSEAMRPKGFIDLTAGNFHFSQPVEVKPGVFVRRWAEGDQDRPTVIHYQADLWTCASYRPHPATDHGCVLGMSLWRRA